MKTLPTLNISYDKVPGAYIIPLPLDLTFCPLTLQMTYARFDIDICTIPTSVYIDNLLKLQEFVLRKNNDENKDSLSIWLE